MVYRFGEDKALEEALSLSLKDGEYHIKHLTMHGGVVVLTNQRLLFLKREEEKSTERNELLRKGVPTSIIESSFGKTANQPVIRTKSFKLKHDIPLESIQRIDLSASGWFGYLDVYTKRNKYNFMQEDEEVWAFEVKPFRETVIQQMKERRQELEREKMPVVIDFSFLKTVIEKGGIVLTTLKCPHCSAPIKMPKDGTETVCEHCGSTVYAQDIFEKVKRLIE